jgi:hypothetical protein
MGTGFEGDVKVRAARLFPSLAQGEDFGMGLSGLWMETFADDVPVKHDDRPDGRIGAGASLGSSSQLQSPGHVIFC